MQTVGGMKEVDVIIRKKLSIEVSGCCMNKESSMILVFLCVFFLRSQGST